MNGVIEMANVDYPHSHTNKGDDLEEMQSLIREKLVEALICVLNFGHLKQFLVLDISRNIQDFTKYPRPHVFDKNNCQSGDTLSKSLFLWLPLPPWTAALQTHPVSAAEESSPALWQPSGHESYRSQ